MAATRTCTIPDCNRPHEARGWCHHHYKTWHRNGNPTTTRQPIHIEDIEWMANTGETFPGAAMRLGRTPNTLHKYLTRAGRLDLAHQLTHNHNHNPASTGDTAA